MSDEVAHLAYRVRWRAGEARPGKHPARQTGLGGDFRAFRPFWQLPDARRIDVRRSIVDPFEDLIVRQMENRAAIAVVLIADLSRSMAAATGALHSVATLARCAARAVQRAGDGFGFLGFDEQVRETPHLAPTRSRGAAAELLSQLDGFAPTGRHARGVARLGAHLPERRCLVLLASDFLMPLDLLELGLEGLARHDVVPVVLHDANEAALPRRGLLRLRDAETGGTRLMLMRPALQARWAVARRARQDALDGVFGRHSRAAFHSTGRLDVAALGEHLLAG